MQQLEQERTKLKKEKEKYNSLDGFVQYSKIEMRILSLDKEINNLKPEFNINTINNAIENPDGLYSSLVNFIFQNVTTTQILNSLFSFVYSVFTSNKLDLDFIWDINIS